MNKCKCGKEADCFLPGTDLNPGFYICRDCLIEEIKKHNVTVVWRESTWKN